MRRGFIAFMCGVFIVSAPFLSDAGSIKWETYKEGMAKGKSEKRKIFVNFHADW